MSKLVKITVILAIAVVAIAARQLSSPIPAGAALSLAPASSVSPAELTRQAGPLPETEVASYF